MNRIAYALRKLARTPTFTFLSILTLALGLTAATTIFSVVNGILLEPLPYPETDELVMIRHSAPGLDLNRLGISVGLYKHYRDNAGSFEGISMFRRASFSLTGGGGDPEQLRGWQMTPGFFTVLGVLPVGRPWLAAEGLPGAAPVVILSDELRRRFGDTTDILGHKIDLDGVAHEVVGVMPPGFKILDQDAELFLPLALDPENLDIGNFSGSGMARLKDGTSTAAATTELQQTASQLEEIFPEQSAASVLANADFFVKMESLRESVVGDIEASLWILLATVGLVLLIACANVANLFLVRAEGRQQEIAVRLALGAGRRELIHDATVESLVMSLAAGVAGLAGAALAVRGLIEFGPRNLPRLDEIGIDGRVVAVCAFLTLLTGLAFGLISGWQRIRDLSIALKDGGRASTGGRERHRARFLLVGAQISLALVLLVCAGLMVRSFLRLSAVDPGFTSDGILTAALSLPASSYETDVEVASFYSRLTERVAALPGVVSAGAISYLPLQRSMWAQGFSLEDFPTETGGLPPVFGLFNVTPGAFDTLGIRLLSGRLLSRADADNRTGAILVSTSLARHYWGEKEAIGKRIGPEEPDEAGGPEEAGDPWYTIVGVVEDIRVRTLETEPEEVIYFSILGKGESRRSSRRMTVVARTDSEIRDAILLANPLRQAVWELDAHLPISRLRTLDSVVEASKARTSFTVVLLMIAGAVSLLLGSVGTFGIISYLVTQRTQEIGVRMALGAGRLHIILLVMREGLILALGGTSVGVAASLVVTRWLESILFEIDPLDPMTFVLVPILLATIALVATFFPALRAASVQPTVALHHE